MHILHVYKEYFTFGGIQQLIRQLGGGMVARGDRVSVLTLGREAKVYSVTDDQGVMVHTYPMDFEVASNGISFSAFRHFRSLAKTADILHYHFPWPTGDLLHQIAPKGIPSVVTYHSDIVRQKLLGALYAPLRERFLGQMDAIVATSPTYAASSPVLQRYKAKTHCIPIGIDEANYPVPTPEVLAAWQAKLPARFLLYVGVLRYYKGLHTLLQAAKLCDVPVVIVGRGPLANELTRQAASIPHLYFMGEVSEMDKMALLSLCEGFVFPSHLRSEAFGISLLEAAMCGKPMISCEIGSGMSYININGETGFSIPPENPQELAEVMVKLHRDEALRARLGAGGRKRYETLFTGAIMTESYGELYEDLLSDKVSSV
ncbi:MAG: glycosyltransferase [Alphaproteobacteria bacterium]|nr:glycosyltransferase [Alphaproteobacteria bacterium]